MNRLAAALTLALAAMPLTAIEPPPNQEVLTYEWQLTGAIGRLAGLVLPSRGEGELRSRAAARGGLVTELEITAPDSNQGEFFLYGAELGPEGGTREAWSSYRWRGETKDKRAEVEEEEVIDIASGIQLIRKERPRHDILRIWSDGKVYSVVVRALGPEVVKVPAGRYETVHYEIRGLNRPGDRPWKGGLDLWLADGPAATPVQIVVSRGWANVRLELSALERVGPLPLAELRR